MAELVNTFTSTGGKFFHHQEAMRSLRDGRGRPIVTHLMPTDLCQHTCAFCSVQTRDGNTLPMKDMLVYLDTLMRYGLKAVIISGGGNPILYKCPVSHANFNDLVGCIADRGLEIGLITNGMPLRKFEVSAKKLQCVAQDPDAIIDSAARVGHPNGLRYRDIYCLGCHCFRDSCVCNKMTIRESWGTVRPETLDKLAWVRISMSGLDHDEREVFVPDVDPSKTTLGFSYVLHDLYDEPADIHHGKVSTQADLITLGSSRLSLKPTWWAKDRVGELTVQIEHYVRIYRPRYVRLLPNCLEPDLISERCIVLQKIADAIDPDVVFVQYKPPAAPKACYLGYIHPVLNSDGYVYPCDSCVLNREAGHKFAEPWRICRWDEVSRLYEQPVRNLIDDPKVRCPGCVFTASNTLLGSVVDGTADLTLLAGEGVEHANFV